NRRGLDVGWQGFDELVALTQYNRETVIEFVRYAASEASPGLHLLGLEQLSLESPLLRDVAHEGLIVLHAARPVAHGADAELDGQPATVLPLPGRFDLVVLPLGVAIAVQQTLPLGGVGVHVACHVEPEDLRR